MDSQMKELGLIDRPQGSWLTVNQAVEELMEHVGVKPIDGTLYIQVMADAVRVFRRSAFTTVAIRALQDVPDFNSMTSMCIL